MIRLCDILEIQVDAFRIVGELLQPVVDQPQALVRRRGSQVDEAGPIVLLRPCILNIVDDHFLDLVERRVVLCVGSGVNIYDVDTAKFGDVLFLRVTIWGDFPCRSCRSIRPRSWCLSVQGGHPPQPLHLERLSFL